MKNANPIGKPATEERAMLRVLKILGLMGLGSVLTLAALFLSGAGLVWRSDHNFPPPLEFDLRSGAGSEPGVSPRRFAGYIAYNTRYTPSAASAGPEAHMVARQALAAGAVPGDAATFALAGHRVGEGTGAIVSYQHAWGLDEPGQYPPEAEFEKLTIYLKKPFAGETGSVTLGEESGAFAFWSSGPTNPPWDRACIGYAAEGRIDYRRNRDRYELDLDLGVQPVRAGTGQVEGCEPVRVKQHASAWIGKVEYLDAWDGAGWGRVTIHEAVPERGF